MKEAQVDIVINSLFTFPFGIFHKKKFQKLF